MHRPTAISSDVQKAPAFRAICSLAFSLVFLTPAPADDVLRQPASWQVLDAEAMAMMLRGSLDKLGVAPDEMDRVTDHFVTSIETTDADPLDAYVTSLRGLVPVVDQLVGLGADSIEVASDRVDPNSPTYRALEALPKTMRMSVRTWLGRALVRQRMYDEALPVIAEVDPLASIDPAAALFYRGACYHALLMKKEALTDLRRLLENDETSPVRFVRTAQMMIADIKPLKEDSLDEISRIMSDVTRRLDLGRTDEDVRKQEQKIIDKLTKLIEKIEEEQQQQQQQQQSSGGQGDGQGGQGAPMDDSRIAGANGAGDVDKKRKGDFDSWGNLPPAERQQAIQQISRDLPTHYREAIEAYFRKLATDQG